jgi:hypothetical protein
MGTIEHRIRRSEAEFGHRRSYWGASGRLKGIQYHYRNLHMSWVGRPLSGSPESACRGQRRKGVTARISFPGAPRLKAVAAGMFGSRGEEG